MLVNLDSVLKKAQKEQYAVGLFNTIDTDMLEAAISAAEEMNSPIIIGTAEVLLPYGELKLIAPSVIAAAKRASVPVVVHYDHGLTFERCIEALQLGFSSVMFDGSAGDSEKNIADTREIVRIAHAMGATVEGEIGHVGEAASGDNAVSDRYTTVKEAQDFLNATGVDALAIAIGTAHGAYKIKPCLDFERLKEIRANVDTPLVLHGGSGLSDDDFRNTIKNGIAKINIFTDLCIAGENAVNVAISEQVSYLEMRNRKVSVIRESVKKKIALFGSQNKATI
ncbi:MAG: class II fructose-bisphosphate aldolase [Clostridia bacterium]|nr:class II fructose-bisphosphate aldolase [Clostridia bacterium]